MNKYKDMPDIEINLRVAEYDPMVEQVIKSNEKNCTGIICHRVDSSSVEYKDYCNFIKDAIPIAFTEGFDIMNKLDGEWCVQDPLFDGNFALAPESIDENPCRAIAICYLMKKDLENEKKTNTEK